MNTQHFYTTLTNRLLFHNDVMSCCAPWAIAGGPLWAPSGPGWAGPLWAPWALGASLGPCGQDPCGPPLGLYGPGPCGRLGPLGAPWALRAGPLWSSLGPYGPGPYGLPWALMGRALIGPSWALLGGALMGWALIGPMGDFLKFSFGPLVQSD